MRLPLAPLIERIEHQGGLHSLLVANGVSDQSAEYDKYTAAIRRARRAGNLLTPAAADTICIRLLGRHPFEVYGEAWWPNTTAVAA